MKVYWKAPVPPEMQLGTYNVRPIYRDPNVYRARKLFKNVRRDPDRQKFFANFFSKSASSVWDYIRLTKNYE